MPIPFWPFAFHLYCYFSSPAILFLLISFNSSITLVHYHFRYTPLTETFQVIWWYLICAVHLNEVWYLLHHREKLVLQTRIWFWRWWSLWSSLALATCCAKMLGEYLKLYNYSHSNEASILGLMLVKHASQQRHFCKK